MLTRINNTVSFDIILFVNLNCDGVEAIYKQQQLEIFVSLFILCILIKDLSQK